LYWNSVLREAPESQTIHSFLADMGHVVRFEVFTAVPMKNAIFWDVTSHKVQKFDGL
jgi:hypothetical protein